MSNNISTIEIAAHTSCLREQGLSAVEGTTLLDELKSPKAGDLLIAKALAPKGAYDYIEYGADEKHVFSEGETAVLVLGDRFSGAQIYGTVPDQKLVSGDELDLISGAGMVGKAHYIPSWSGGDTTKFKVVGFLSQDGKTPLNLQTVHPTPAVTGNHDLKSVSCVFIGGTSAQVGKTTFARNLMRVISDQSPQTRIAAIKATGTSSSKYLDLYKEAGADFATDYVHQGHPTTYGLDTDVFRSALENMILQSAEHADVVVIELGGDLWGANSPEAVKLASDMGSDFVLVANDAMGAAEAMKILKDEGVANTFISSFRQNLYSLSKRINFPMSHVIDMNIPTEMGEFAKRNTGVEKSLIPQPKTGLVQTVS